MSTSKNTDRIRTLDVTRKLRDEHGGQEILDRYDATLSHAYDREGASLESRLHLVYQMPRGTSATIHREALDALSPWHFWSAIADEVNDLLADTDWRAEAWNTGGWCMALAMTHPNVPEFEEGLEGRIWVSDIDGDWFWSTEEGETSGFIGLTYSGIDSDGLLLVDGGIDYLNRIAQEALVFSDDVYAIAEDIATTFRSLSGFVADLSPETDVWPSPNFTKHRAALETARSTLVDVEVTCEGSAQEG